MSASGSGWAKPSASLSVWNHELPTSHTEAVKGTELGETVVVEQMWVSLSGWLANPNEGGADTERVKFVRVQ